MKNLLLKLYAVPFALLFMVSTCSNHPLDTDEKQYQEQLGDDPKPGFKNLGPQIMENKIQGSAFAQDKDGKKLIYTVVRGTTAHLIGIDAQSKNVVVDLPLEGTNGSFDVKVSTDGWLYIAGNERNFYRHFPGSSEITNLGEVLPGEHYVWELTPGKNGEIFGATYPGCKVFRYHPKDGFSDVGGGTLVTGESYVRSIVYHKKSDKIYAGVGSHAHLVELDPRTGIKREFLPSEFKAQEFVYMLSIVEDADQGDKLFIYLDKSGKSLIYNIEQNKFQGELPQYINVKSIINSATKEIAYYARGSSLYSLDLKNFESTLIGDVGGRTLVMDLRKDGLLDFLTDKHRLFEYDPTSKILKSVGLKIPSNPIQINCVGIGPNNMIWTSGFLNGSNAQYNPANRQTTMHIGLSQAESITSLGKFVFFGLYPGSKIFMYDTGRAWDVSSKNPKQIARVSGQDRPYGSIPLADLNKVYFGTAPTYGKNGGALIEYDLATNKATTFNQVVQNQSIISFAYSGGLLYGGTSNKGGLGVDPTETEAKLFVWDPISKLKLSEIVPVKNAKSVSALSKAKDGKIWGLASGTLFVFDPATSSVVYSKKLFNFTGSVGGLLPSSIIFHPNGKIYGMELRNFFELDPVSMEMKVLDKPIAHLVIDKFSNLYYSKSSDLWQYTP